MMSGYTNMQSQLWIGTAPTIQTRPAGARRCVKWEIYLSHSGAIVIPCHQQTLGQWILLEKNPSCHVTWLEMTFNHFSLYQVYSVGMWAEHELYQNGKDCPSRLTTNKTNIVKWSDRNLPKQKCHILVFGRRASSRVGLCTSMGRLYS